MLVEIISSPAGPAAVGDQAAVVTVNVRVRSAAWLETAGAAGGLLGSGHYRHPGLDMREDLGSPGPALLLSQSEQWQELSTH